MNFDGFHPFVLPRVGNCPLQTVDFAVRQAAIDFCAKTLVWTEDLDEVLADPGRTEYPLALDDQVELAKLIEVRIDSGEALQLLGGPDGLERRRRTHITCPTAWLVDRRTLNVVPVPSDGAAIQVYAALKPSQNAFSFPDEVFAHHAEHIADGALERLFALPQQAWTDLGLAAYHGERFRDRVATQARAAARGHTRHSRRSPSTRFY